MVRISFSSMILATSDDQIASDQKLMDCFTADVYFKYQMAHGKN